MAQQFGAEVINLGIVKDKLEGHNCRRAQGLGG